MCVGIPMQVVSGDGTCATCERRGERKEVDMRLVGAQAPGVWVLVFLDAARRMLTDEEALRTNQALDALELVLAGGRDIDALFPDLIGRELQLPEYLRGGST